MLIIEIACIGLANQTGGTEYQQILAGGCKPDAHIPWSAAAIVAFGNQSTTSEKQAPGPSGTWIVHAPRKLDALRIHKGGEEGKQTRVDAKHATLEATRSLKDAKDSSDRTMMGAQTANAPCLFAARGGLNDLHTRPGLGHDLRISNQEGGQSLIQTLSRAYSAAYGRPYSRMPIVGWRAGEGDRKANIPSCALILRWPLRVACMVI